MLDIVAEMFYWMQSKYHSHMLEDPANVVVVHCMSGKGRTGTLIISLLLYSGLATNLEDACRYYGHKRFSGGKGVS